MDGILNDRDSSWVAGQAMAAIRVVCEEWSLPSAIYRPKIYPDGNKWCALYGEDLQNGVCGFGDSPQEAMDDFNRSWNKPITTAIEPAGEDGG